MHSLKKTTFAILTFALLLASFISNAAPNKDPAHEWLIYLFQVFKSADTIREVIASESEKDTDPRRRKFAKVIVSAFDGEALVLRISPLVSSNLTKEELAQCDAFTISPTGKRILSITNKFSTFGEAQPSLEAMPAGHQDIARAFFSSSCYKKTMEFLASPQFREASRAYGAELACNEFQKSDPQMYKSFKRQGYCN